MRYGHQRIPDIFALPLDEMLGWAEEITALVMEENEKSPLPSGEG